MFAAPKSIWRWRCNSIPNSSLVRFSFRRQCNNGGQKTKGRVFSIAAAALAGATFTGHLLRRRAEQKYLRAGENDVAARYGTFNRYHQLRNNLALSLGVVWSAAVLDAFIVRVEPASKKMGIIFLPASMTGTAGLAV